MLPYAAAAAIRRASTAGLRITTRTVPSSGRQISLRLFKRDAISHKVPAQLSRTVATPKSQVFLRRLGHVAFATLSFYTCWQLFAWVVIDPLLDWAELEWDNLSEKEKREMEASAETDEPILFLPFPFTTKEVGQPPYKGSDPESSVFSALNKDRKARNEITAELAEFIRRGVEKNPTYLWLLGGKEVRIRKVWLDIIFPQVPPPKHHISGIIIDDDGIYWGDRPIDSLAAGRLNMVLYPKAVALSVWTFVKSLCRETYQGLAERMLEQIEEDTGSVPANLPKGITGEQAAENPQVQAIIEPRLTMLTEIANGFLATIIEGLEETPYGIRWICKQIRSLTKRKYPDANDQVICTLIGGFFFLRFINPAIVTPKSYMLIDGTPAERPRRTLTLIAKMLQNLANKPSYAKEPYMAKLQPFIHQNKDRINKFMLDLCEVSDFYESLEVDNYVALSKKDLELDITLNEIYAMHGLIDKHYQELCKDESSHLATIVAELGSSPPQVPRKENRVIKLPLFSRWETAIDDLTAALDITQEEVYFMEAKSIFVQILRTIPQSSAVLRRPLRLERVADAAATSRNDAVMVRKGIRAMELLSQLQELGVIDKSDQFDLLRDEVEQELQHLGSLKEGVIAETLKLEEVYKTIRDHNTYLVGQLETYKSYLHNVRSQSEGTKRKQQKQQVLGPYKFTHQQLEKEGVIQKSNVPDNRRTNIYFNFTSPLPGTFVISLHYKGRNRGLLELDLKLDDLLEMQKDNQDELDLEYVQFNVPKVLALLNKRFARKKGW